MSITDFLLARIKEDEGRAKHVQRQQIVAPAEPWRLSSPVYALLFVDPSRVLAECQAKRAIIDEHGGSPPFHVDPCDAHDPVSMETIPCDTLRHLAAVYADHPDYRESWRP